MGAEADVDDAVLRARAYLSRVAEPASVVMWEWVRRVGPVEAADAIRAGVVPEPVAAATAARRERIDVDADLDAAGRHGIRLITPEHEDWPHFALAAMERTAARRWEQWQGGDRAARPAGEAVPPLALWVRGSLAMHTLAVRSVGIVGARAATEYGVHVASELGYGLAGRDVAVVSGGAYGIDAAAHRGALAAEGATVLVSAGGLDRPYPGGHADLYERIAETGLLISESPPGAAPHRRRFLSRNRLIAALSTGTVVVEAGRRSGALNTAAHARRLGRALMAVPGPITSAASVGCHDLLRGAEAGEPGAARLVTGVDDVLAEIGAPGEGLSEPALPAAASSDPRATSGGGSRGEQSAIDGLDAEASAVHDALRARRFLREDELSVISALPVPQVRQALAALLLYELAESGPDGYRINPRSRTG
ncbi:MAG: processing protein [Pseudonocardiales bacterium]|nr:processing protein [Pseudonocardiales bacterium]